MTLFVTNQTLCPGSKQRFLVSSWAPTLGFVATPRMNRRTGAVRPAVALPDNLKQTRWLVWDETKMVTNLTHPPRASRPPFASMLTSSLEGSLGDRRICQETWRRNDGSIRTYLTQKEFTRVLIPTLAGRSFSRQGSVRMTEIVQTFSV